MIRLLIALLLLAALPARGEEVVAGLSQSRVAITANFDGSEILIFGAVKRDSPAVTEPPLEVVIAIAGPSEPVTVRRKDRRLGLWVNTDEVTVARAPSFYAVATSAPMSEALNQTEDLRHQITINRAIRATGIADMAENSRNFTQALIRIRTANGLYATRAGSITLDEDTLFRTSIALPSNLTEGNYTTRIFLTRGGDVVDSYETLINVQKVGLERWIFALAHERPLIYGLLSLVIAISAGWTASAIFRYLLP